MRLRVDQGDCIHMNAKTVVRWGWRILLVTIVVVSVATVNQPRAGQASDPQTDTAKRDASRDRQPVRKVSSDTTTDRGGPPRERLTASVRSLRGAQPFRGTTTTAAAAQAGIALCSQTANCQARDNVDAKRSNRTDFRVADDFRPSASGNITEACWWGTYGDDTGGTLVDCYNANVVDTFEITYCNDAGGFPGTTCMTFSPALGNLTVTGPTATGGLISGFLPEFAYTATHAPFAVTAEQCYWIEITNDSGACTWFWEVSSEGGDWAMLDGDGVSPPDGVFELDEFELFDLAFCVDVGLSAASPCGPPADIVCPNPAQDCCVEDPIEPPDVFGCQDDLCCRRVCACDPFCCDSEGTCNGRGGTCLIHADCPSGQTCEVEGTCTGSGDACLVQADCPFGQTCDGDRTCSVSGGTCIIDNDCPSGETCDGIGTCSVSGNTCVSDANCPSGETCVGDGTCNGTGATCLIGAAPCSFQQTCDGEGTCNGSGAACVIDADCPAGQTCDVEGTCAGTGGTCQVVADCPAGQTCAGLGAWDQFCAGRGQIDPATGLPDGCGAEVLCVQECSPCGGPNTGDCCADTGSASCNDLTCCEAVCAEDPFCCEITWDDICAVEAETICPALCGVCGNPNLPRCCEANPLVAGCSDRACCDAVCAADLACCEPAFGWDSFCATIGIGESRAGALYLCSDLCNTCNVCGDIAGDGISANGLGSNADLADYAAFLDCFDADLRARPECFCSDLNDDQVINELDYKILVGLLESTSTNLPPNCVIPP